MRILILGGYGGVGSALARLLARNTACDLVVAGRSGVKAEIAADALRKEYPRRNIAGRAVNVWRPESLAAALTGVDLALACVSGPTVSGEIALAAAQAGADCVDLRYPQELAPYYRSLRGRFEKMGRCCLIQAGHLPGLPSALLRYAAIRLPGVKRVTLSTAMRVPRINKTGAALEMVDIVRDMKMEVYRDRRWRQQGIFGARRVRFETGFGVKWCVPVRLEEMADLPNRLGLSDAALYVAGLNPFVDNCLMPAIVLTRRWRTQGTTEFFGRFLAWGVRAFSKPPFGAVFSMEACGDNGCRLRLDLSAPNRDSYEFAAIAVLGQLFQYLDGSIRRAGARFMGHEVDPERLLRDMAQLGVEIRCQEIAA